MDDQKLPINQQGETVTLADREALIKEIPIFSTLSTAEIAALASLMTEVYFDVGHKIVNEGDLIDSVYIIVSGTAEVTQKLTVAEKSGETLLATLNKGEPIGLSEAGFFTTTGVRTATVTALSACVLLKLSLPDLNQFLKAHPALMHAIQEQVGWMLRMRFIKEAAPFAQFSHQRIAWLASLVKEVHVDVQEIIFRQGEIADSCYLICEGKIEILMQQPDGIEKSIAIL